ncbi:carotenoid oxygenase family protein [Nocardia sp. NBC_00416]|uniref:carotenoid oxygenase family protein n=1 Tax=Nocardia sp. NBC_00416 TaxID=2975991 RepID=UPI002E229691
MSDSATAPWLTGLFAPVPDEIDAYDLPVEGTLPPELTGRYFRNGPNPELGGASAHWFIGDGMVHGVRLREGRAEWYRNRWVRTTRFTEGASLRREDGTVDRAAVSANTHVIAHADRIMALVESGFPHELTPELDTVGPRDFGGRLTTAMTAHPKRDPRTGELLFFGYGFAPPYLTYHRLSAAGELVESRVVEVGGPTMMHDFAITEHYVVWLDLPVVFDRNLLGGMPYRWDSDYPARLGVMPRAGGAVRWFDIDPCYVFHVGNAYEDTDGKIVLDAVRYAPEDFTAIWSGIGGDGAAGSAGASRLHRWVLDIATGRAVETQCDDRDVEFPTHDEQRTGLPSRYLYAVGDSSIVKYDVGQGSATSHELGSGFAPGEAVFVPASDAGGEDEGWLLTITSDRGGHGSELLILDAGDLSRTASVRLPRRVPAGFHGSWIAD